MNLHSDHLSLKDDPSPLQALVKEFQASRAAESQHELWVSASAPTINNFLGIFSQTGIPIQRAITNVFDPSRNDPRFLSFKARSFHWVAVDHLYLRHVFDFQQKSWSDSDDLRIAHLFQNLISENGTLWWLGAQKHRNTEATEIMLKQCGYKKKLGVENSELHITQFLRI